MTQETREAVGNWLADQVKSLGFPIVVAAVLFAHQKTEADFSRQRQVRQDEIAEKRQTWIEGTLKDIAETSNSALNNSTSAINALNATVAAFRDDQRETREIMRQVRDAQQEK